MKKKKIWTVIAIVLNIVALFVVTIFVTDYIEINNIRKELWGVENIKDKESAFEKKPTLKLAIILMDKYKHVEFIRNIEKVEFYGKKAIDLGGNNKPIGFYVNIWLASVYHEKGNDEIACNFFNKASELQNVQNQNILSEELLKQEGLDNVFTKYCRTLKDK